MRELRRACLATRVISKAAAYLIDEGTCISDLRHSLAAHYHDFVDFVPM